MTIMLFVILLGIVIGAVGGAFDEPRLHRAHAARFEKATRFARRR
jgi:phosphopantetheine adenylyltransferase